MFGSIDDKLAGLSIEDKKPPVPRIVTVKKKRPARAYHDLSPRATHNMPNSPGSINPFSPLPESSGSGFSAIGGIVSPVLNSFKNAASTFSPNLGGKPKNTSVPYPSGSHSNPISPFSPPAPASLQFQWQAEQQRPARQLSSTAPRSRDVSLKLNAANNGSSGSGSRSDELSVAASRSHDQQQYFAADFLTFQNTCPPQSTTDYTAKDQGTASGKHILASLYSVPSTEQLRASAGLPVSAHVMPFSAANEIPQVDWREIGCAPIRCENCRVYINPTVQFTHTNSFICNMCQHVSPLPEAYQAPLSADFRRVDHASRPELNSGVVDFVLPEKYYDTVEPQPLHYMFVIDMSASSVQKGVVSAACDAVRSVLNSGILPEGAKIALLTFDRNVQFYNLDANLSVPIVSVVSDPEKNMVPFSSGIFVDPNESYMMIEQALQYIENTPSGKRFADSCFGGALQCAVESIRAAGVGGGKLFVSLSGIPSFNPGLLSLKAYEKYAELPEHRSHEVMFSCNNDFYKDLAKKFADSAVGVDLFAFSNYVDLVNSGFVSHLTGGSIKMYDHLDPERFAADLVHSISSTVGYSAKVIVRCSKGLAVQKYYGAFGTADGKSEPSLPAVSTESAFDVVFKYTGKLNTSLDCHFQAAVLYTCSSGLRKLRVINLVAAVTDRITDVFAFANQDAITSLIVRDCVAHIHNQSAGQIKESLDTKVCKIVASYRKRVLSENTSNGEFVIPQSLATLPAFILAFEKQRAFKKCSAANNSKRILNVWRLATMCSKLLSYTLYPYITGLHNLAADDCEYNEIYLKYSIPKGVEGILSSIEVGGCYFAFNGTNVLIWIHNEINQQFLVDLFGVESIKDVQTSEIPELDTHLNHQVRNLVRYFTTKVLDTEHAPVKIVRFSLDDQMEFLELFVEDKGIDGVQSYGDYLTEVHKRVTEELS